MGDIKGESTAGAHEGWFEVTTWSFEGSGSDDPAALSRRQSAGAITVQLERSNPVLTEACTGGRSLGTVILHLRSGENPTAYDEYRLQQSGIRACGRMADGRGGSVTLTFTRVETTPAAGNPDRPVVIGR
jgi:type VI protein secretion system component Hcp